MVSFGRITDEALPSFRIGHLNASVFRRRNKVGPPVCGHNISNGFAVPLPLALQRPVTGFPHTQRSIVRFALLLLPAAIAQHLTTRPYAALGLAALLAVGCTWVGIAIGFYTGYPSSVCISLFAVAGYAVTVAGHALIRRFAPPSQSAPGATEGAH